MSLPMRGWFDFNTFDIWRYKVYCGLWNVIYQLYINILGPFWLFIQPLLTTIVYTVIFGKVVNPNRWIARFILYGGCCLELFFNCLSSTSNTFTSNASLFSGTFLNYSTTIEGNIGLLRFGIQFLLFFGFLFILLLIGNDAINPSSYLLIPLLILQMAVLGLGIGLLVSSMTIKYET